MNVIMEATALISQCADGWHFAIQFADGDAIEADGAYPTKQAALSALDAFCEETGAMQMDMPASA